MKKLLTISALSLAMGIACIGTKAVRETKATEATDIELTAVESNLLTRLGAKFGDSTVAAKTFIAEWVDDDSETKGLNFFEAYNEDPTTATYDDEYVTQAKNAMYFDVLLGSYLLTDFYCSVDQYRCFADHFIGQVGTFKTYFETLNGFNAGEKTNQEFFEAANECYLAGINWLEECLDYLAENPEKPDPGDPDHWIEIHPTLENTISSFKSYLVTPNIENKKDHRLVDFLKTDYPFIEGVRETFNTDKLIDKRTAFDLLGFSEDLADFWVADPVGYLANVDLDFMKESCLKGILFTLDWVELALTEYSIPSSVDLIEHFNDFGPTFYLIIEAIETYQYIEDEPCCADKISDAVTSLLIFKEEVFIPQIKSDFNGKLDILKAEVEDLFATEIHSPTKCKEVCAAIDSKAGYFTIYMSYLMPLMSMSTSLHTDSFSDLISEAGAFMSEVQTREDGLKSVWIDEIESDLDIFEKELAMAIAMLEVAESDFTKIDNFAGQIATFAEYIDEEITVTKGCFTNPKLTELAGTFASYKEALVEFQADLQKAKRVCELLNPIKSDLEYVGDGIYAVTGMLTVLTDDFVEVDEALADLNETIEEVEAAIATAKEELGETDDIKALNNQVSYYKLLIVMLENAVEEAKSISSFVVQKNTALDGYQIEIAEALAIGLANPEEYNNVKEVLEDEIPEFEEIKADVDNFIMIHGENDRLTALKDDISYIEAMNSFALLLIEQAHDEYVVVKEVTDIYTSSKEAFDFIEGAYKSEDALINDVQETIEDAIKALKTIPGIVEEYEDEGSEVEELHTIMDKAVLLIADYEDLLNDALVFATQKEYEALKAEYEAVEAIYKLDDEKAETYFAKCTEMLDKVNDIKTEILARKDAVEDQEGLDAVNALLSDLRNKIDATRTDIDLRHHEIAVTKIVEKGSAFDERVEEITTNFKHNEYHFKGDLSECDALIEEMNAVIAEIDEKADSLNQDSRLTNLRAKLAAHVEAVEAAKESINKAHALTVTLIIVGSVLFVFGILALLYFFGFKKRFLRKNA